MNLDNPRRNGIWRVAIFLIALAVLLLVLDQRGSLNGVAAMVETPLAAVTDRFRGFTNAIRIQRYDDVYTQVSLLEAEVDALERENELLRESQIEVIRLQALLNYTQNTPLFTRVTANVVGRGADPTFQDIIIDQGSADGVRVGMPVENVRGLVGQVVRTTPDTAQVLLLTDSATRIPGRLQQSRAIGMINGGELGGLLSLQELSLEAQLTQNELIFTSGLTGSSNEELITNRFPADLVIGRVVEIRRGTAELYQEAIIQPAVDFDTLETVFVITDFVPIDATIFNDG